MPDVKMIFQAHPRTGKVRNTATTGPKDKIDADGFRRSYDGDIVITTTTDSARDVFKNGFRFAITGELVTTTTAGPNDRFERGLRFSENGSLVTVAATGASSQVLRREGGIVVDANGALLI
jgi:hypothetical protein